MTVEGSLSDRVAVVTGAASGIGLATSRLLAKRGCRVIGVDLAPIEGIDADDVVIGDVSTEATNKCAVDLAIEKFGRLDILILNAGLVISGGLFDPSILDFERALAVNLTSVVHGLRVGAPILPRGTGRIVVTASVSGLAGDPTLWAYNAAKAGAVNLVRAAALELACEGITVNAVCPGPTTTGMTSDLRAHAVKGDALRRSIPLQRWGTPDEIAAVIAFLASDEASFVTGVAIPVDGGIMASTGQFKPRRSNLPGLRETV